MTLVRERILLDPPPRANLGPVRARTPEQIDEMRRLRDAGVSVHSIARKFELHPRTVYRYLGSDALYVVEVDGWSATFAVRGQSTPTRITEWARTSS